ncbi:MAG: protein kinase [candidate division WOR-3 bacterium]|nr:protein kinase [candidate division WOR-3 bacterium]
MVLEKGVVFAEKYEIIKVISSGAQAVVYTALQKPLERIVILKVLSPILSADEENVKRFEREAKVLSALKEENVTKIFDFGKHSGLYYFVTEYVEGLSLKEFLEKKGKLSPELASYIILEISKVLARLHEQGIIHRDLKPSNILIGYDGKIKLTDFGLAISQALPSITVEGSILGTPGYMSPEQITGKPIDHRSDIFSLGVVFYELITGHNPFIASTYSAIMQNVLNLKIAPFYKLDQSLIGYKDLWQIIERMLKKSAQDRFQKISELCEKLEEWMAEKPKVDLKKEMAEILLMKPKSDGILTQPQTTGKKVRLSYFYLIIALLMLIAGIFIGFNKINRKAQLQFSSLPIDTLFSRIKTRHDSIQLSEFVSKASSKDKETTKRDSLGLEITSQKNARGYLKISVVPWADVYLDGEKVFTTPKDTIIDLKVGMHNLKLINPNFPAIETLFSINPNDNLKLVFNLFDYVGYLQVAVQPWADIYIDDVYKATSPIATPIIVPIGKHKITLRNPYYPPYEETIEFKPQATVERNIVLR